MKKVFILFLTIFFTATTTFAQTKDGFVELPKDLVWNYGDAYSYNIDFKHTGKNDNLKTTLNVTKGSHGFEMAGPYPKSNNIYSFRMFGTAKVFGKQKFAVTIYNGTSKLYTGDININVVGLEFATSTLPVLYGTGKMHTIKVPYKYAGKQLMRFSYNFPTSFQYHETENYNPKNDGYMTLKVTPYKTGKFTLGVTVYGEDPYGTGNLVMARKNFEILVKNENEIPKPIVATITPAVPGVATSTKATSTKPTTKPVVTKKKIIQKKTVPQKSTNKK